MAATGPGADPNGSPAERSLSDRDSPALRMQSRSTDVWGMMNAAARLRASIEAVARRFIRTGVNHGRPRSAAGSSGSRTGHSALSVSSAGPIPVPAIHLPALPDTARNAGPNPSLIAAWRQAGFHGNLKYEELSLPELLRSADKNLALPKSTLREAIVGYRVWRVFWDRRESDSPTEPRLGSAHYDEIAWEPGVPMSGDVDAARPQRRTGVNAYSDKAKMIAGSIAPCVQGMELIVAGTVSLWGTVIVYEHGYRAQFAYPRQLCWTNGSPSLLQDLAAIYGCEVYVPSTPELDAA